MQYENSGRDDIINDEKHDLFISETELFMYQIAQKSRIGGIYEVLWKQNNKNRHHSSVYDKIGSGMNRNQNSLDLNIHSSNLHLPHQ